MSPLLSSLCGLRALCGNLFFLELLLASEVLALAAFRAPHERFMRFAFWDSGAELVVQDLVRRGFRPAVDFGYIYGLLPLLIGRAWYGAFGLSPGAFRGLATACGLALAWGLARFSAARRLGAAGLALVVLTVPDALLPTEITLVHALEPALLVIALSEHARGRRASALAVLTACSFIKPSMAYCYGLFLVVALALGARGGGRASWVRAFAPAALTGLILAAVLAAAFGWEPLVRTAIPSAGVRVYRETRCGFFFGSGRDFWVIPGAGLRDYFRYEVGYWLAGSLLLTVGGLAALGRLAARAVGRPARGDPLDDEIVTCCAALHAAFVTLFYGLRGSWAYYVTVLVLGLATLARRDRRHTAAVGVIAALVLVSDRSKLSETARAWSALAPSSETSGLWATPAERAEWSEARARSAGSTPVLLAPSEGAALLTPGFAPPVGGYFYAGYPLPAEVRRKAEQLASAPVVVRFVLPPGWDDIPFWRELTAALDGCETVWKGEMFEVLRRDRPMGDRRRGVGVGGRTGGGGRR